MLNLFVIFLVIISAKLCVCSNRGSNNACKYFTDYATIQHNRNCFNNLELSLSVPEIIQLYDYEFKNYTLTTKDGFVLSLFRVPNRKNSNSLKQRPPILLQHGLSVDTKTFLLLKNQSLVFFLVDNGYDVWLPNARGAEFSDNHVKYSPNDAEYWNYSFHEMATIDIPQIIDFISNRTQQKITYIGHSMGTTSVLAYSSLFPDQAAQKLEKIIAIAPVAFPGNIKGLAKILYQVSTIVMNFHRIFRIRGINAGNAGIMNLAKHLCSETPLIYLCATWSFAFTGLKPSELDPRNLPHVTIYPNYSFKTLLHFMQLIINRDRFTQFDYGRTQNRIVYGSEKAPEYPLDAIKTPVHIFYGKNDFLSVEADVRRLYEKLKTRKSIMEVFSFGHNDFFYGRNAPRFYDILLKCVQNCTELINN